MERRKLKKKRSGMMMRNTITDHHLKKMANHTWKQLYQLAYDPERQDLGSAGREAAIILRDLDYQGQYNPIIQRIAHSPLERAFFMTGEQTQTPSPRRFRVTLGPLAGLVYLLS